MRQSFDPCKPDVVDGTPEAVNLADARGAARSLADRTPEAFAERAASAIADGFRAVKIAPFDRIELYGHEDRRADPALLDAALARIAAVRTAIGPDFDLMVDCHSRPQSRYRRVDRARLGALSPVLARMPGAGDAELIDTMRFLRVLNDRGVRLAGCEEMSLIRGFEPFLEACDVMMPDVK